MNLVLDIGNTFAKMAIFKNNRLEFKCGFELNALQSEVLKIKQNYQDITKVIISAVGEFSFEDREVIGKDIEVLELNQKTELPFQNHYKSPETLGVDRIALVSAAVSQFPGQNCLIIDAGTCITYDIVTDKKIYLGGAISPGVRLRYNALNSYTAKLPLLETERPDSITGTTTASSIHSGVVNGIIKEIDGVINDYKTHYQDLTVILTGGDANFLSNQLKNSIFASSNFLLEGLNYILDFNSQL